MSQKSQTERSASLWHNRNYLLLWGGQLTSSVGDQVTTLAFPLLMLYLTHSTIQAGLVGSFSIIPTIFLGVIAGALVDRWDRRKTMLISDGLRLLNILSIPLAALMGRLVPAQLYLNALLEGVLVSFFFLAHKACLRDVVTNKQLPMAMAQEEVAEGIYTLGGPTLGGLLFSLGAQWPFLADACSYCVSILTVFQLKGTFRAEREPGNKKINLLKDIREGFSWLLKQPVLRTMTLYYASVAFLTEGLMLVLIVDLQQHGASPGLIGLIFGLGGVGSLLGAFLGQVVQRRLSIGQVILGIRWLTALILLSFALAPNPWVIGGIFFFFFLIEPSEDVVYFSYRAAIVPASLQGRIIGASRILSRTASACAPFLAGLLLEKIGVIDTIILYGVYLLLGNAVLSLSPHIRHARMPEEGDDLSTLMKNGASLEHQ